MPWTHRLGVVSSLQGESLEPLDLDSKQTQLCYWIEQQANRTTPLVDLAQAFPWCLLPRAPGVLQQHPWLLLSPLCCLQQVRVLPLCQEGRLLLVCPFCHRRQWASFLRRHQGPRQPPTPGKDQSGHQAPTYLCAQRATLAARCASCFARPAAFRSAFDIFGSSSEFPCQAIAQNMQDGNR